MGCAGNNGYSQGGIWPCVLPLPTSLVRLLLMTIPSPNALQPSLTPPRKCGGLGWSPYLSPLRCVYQNSISSPEFLCKMKTRVSKHFLRVTGTAESLSEGPHKGLVAPCPDYTTHLLIWNRLPQRGLPWLVCDYFSLLWKYHIWRPGLEVRSVDMH